MEKLKKSLSFYVKHRFLINLFFLSMLFFGHCFWGNMMYIVFPIVAILAAADNLENGASYIFFSIPFCFLNVFISPILLLCCAAVYIIKFYIISFFIEKSKPKLLPLLFISIFLLYCLMPIGQYNLNTVIRFMLFAAIFIALCMICKKPQIFRGHFNIKLICISILISSVFSLSYYFSPYLKSYLIIAGVNENLPRFMALFYHTNVLAMFCEFLLACLAFFIVSKKATKIDFILFAALAVVGILTFSKTYIIILFLLLLILLIWRLRCDFKRTIIIFAIVAVVAVAIGFIFPQPIKIFFNRFFGSLSSCKNIQDFMNMITTTRFHQWVEYSHYLGKHPLALFFGRGLGAPILSVYSPHNAYLAAIYELGLVGTTLFCLALYFILKQPLKENHTKIHWAIFIPILVIGLVFMVEDLIFYIFV